MQKPDFPSFPNRPKRIGEILLAQAVLGEEQLETALVFQRAQPGKLLGTVLQELGYITSQDLIEALSAGMRIVRPFGGG